MADIHLTALATQHPCAQSVLRVLARDYPGLRRISCDRAHKLLINEGEDYLIEEVKARLMACCDLGIAQGYEDDAQEWINTWLLMPCVLHESIKHGRPVPLSDGQEFIGKSDLIGMVSPFMVTHRLPVLRDDTRDRCLFRLTLPEDLSYEESRKVIRYIKAIAPKKLDDLDDTPTSAWPFPKDRSAADDATGEFDDMGDDGGDEFEGKEEPLDVSEDDAD